MKIKIFLCAVVFAVALSGAAFAEDSVQQIYTDAAEEFYTEMPNSVKDKVDNSEQPSLTEGLRDIFGDIAADLKSTIAQPVKTFCTIIALLLASSLLESFAFERTTKRVSSAVCTLLVASSLAVGAGGYFEDLFDVITQLQQLSLSFVPAFAGVCASSGLVTSAAGYSAAALGCTQLVSLVITGVAKPLIGIMLAMSIAGTISDWMDTDALVMMIGKTVKWIFSLGTTAFLIITTLQNRVSAYTDAAALTASRFVFSSVVPVVGSSLAESGSVVFGSLNVVNAGVGTLGILSIAAVALPALVKYLLFSLSLKLAATAAGWFGVSSAGRTISAFAECIALCTAAIATLAVMLIFMTAVMITAGN